MNACREARELEFGKLNVNVEDDTWRKGNSTLILVTFKVEGQDL